MEIKFYNLIFVLIILSTILLCLFSCSSNENTAATAPEQTLQTPQLKNPHPSEFPLEPEKKDLPTYSDLCKTEIDMTVDEVSSLIGNPQRTEESVMPVYQQSSFAIKKICYVYDCTGGESLYILWGWHGTESLDDPPIVLNFQLHK